MAACEFCSNYVFDEEEDSYYCNVNLDEDEYYRFRSSSYITFIQPGTLLQVK